jgi:flagellar basal body-associated protein FliL
MEREDPIEKLERQQAEKKANGGLKIIMIVLAIVALALAAALYYVWSTKGKLVNELNEEKIDLTEQIQALQSDYENLSSEYDSINAQLDSSREEIAQLLERVKKSEATDRAKIRQYEKELGTLRSIMRGYINQIDSLNTLNHQLAEEAASARKEAEQTKQINTQLTQQVETLTSRVTAGSIIKAHNFVMYAYNNNDKITDKANRVARFLVNLSLVENELAERGPVRVYVRVTDPEGNLLSDGHGTTFQFNGETLEATASREVDYQGKEVDLGIYINNIGSFQKGVYTVNAYTTQAQLGHGELLLR